MSISGSRPLSEYIRAIVSNGSFIDLFIYKVPVEKTTLISLSKTIHNVFKKKNNICIYEFARAGVAIIFLWFLIIINRYSFMWLSYNCGASIDSKSLKYKEYILYVHFFILFIYKQNQLLKLKAFLKYITF